MTTIVMLFLLCDVQTRFRPAIHAYDHVVSTSNKMIKLAKLLCIPVICTTQNAKALGPIDPAIDLDSLGNLHLGTFDKTLFSMIIPKVKDIINDCRESDIVIFGIESHVCVLQTALFLLHPERRDFYNVYIIADGVSSCNSFEIPVALERMRSRGAHVTTSESLAFELLRDASSPNFKAFSKFIKEEKERTKAAGEALLQHRTPPNNGSESGADVASGDVVVGLKTFL